LRTRPAAYLIVLPLLAASARSAPTPLWSLGVRDHTYAEFAIARRYAEYPRAFPKDVTFQVGKSDPAKDWPFIHPGPVDVWAGSREHPFKLLFDLPEEPKGLFTLTLVLVDTQGIVPPTYRVTVNDATGSFAMPGGGGDTALSDPAAGKEHVIEIPLSASLLRRGENALTFACTQGSWVLYDAVSLSNDPTGAAGSPVIGGLTLNPTMLFAKRGETLKQVVEVVVDLNGAFEWAALELRTPTNRYRFPLERAAAFGQLRTEVEIDPVTAATPLTATVAVPGKTLTAKTTLLPQKRWKLFVAPSTHTDIGYTDLQPKTIERHNQNTDLALDLCREFPGFKWNMEVAYQAETYLADRSHAHAVSLLEAARQGRVGVQALFGNLLTGLCSHESLNRACYYAHSLKRRHGVPFESAMISDVPTQVWSLPTVLAQSGIRYFSAGLNLTRGNTAHYLFDRSPFWWQGPDGSKVLTWVTGGYAQAGALGLDADVEAVAARVKGFLSGRYSGKDYPYDAVFLHGAYSDNVPLNRKIAEIAQQWNARYEYPKIILSTNAEFFRYVEANFASRIPTISGDGGTYWEDGAGSTAAETALDRQVHETLPVAEQLHALAGSLGAAHVYPAEEFARAWENSLLYDEHTWGAHCSISQPACEQTVEQWAYKAKFALDAGAQSQQLLREGLAALANQVAVKGPSVLVYNALSWPRSGLVRVGAKELWVRDVPPLGYRLYPQESLGEATPNSPAEPAATVESRFYRLTFDADTGAVKSCFDKELGRELVDSASEYGLNQYLYVSGGEGTNVVDLGANKPANLTVHTTSGARITREVLPHRQVVRIQAAAQMTPEVESEVVLWDNEKRIDFRNRLAKTYTTAKEAGYFAFPFAVAQPKIEMEIPDSVVRPNTDQFKGACKDWYTVQHWVSVAGDDCTVAWAAVDSPLVCLQDINRGKWQEQLPLENGHVFAYAFNNYWFTNYKAGQGGELEFRFSLTSARELSRTQATRFGWEAANPLLAHETAPGQGSRSADAASFLTVAPENVMVLAVKQAEDGEGLVVRLFENAGKPCTAKLTLPPQRWRRADLCSLVEETQAPLRLLRNAVEIPMKGFGLATVRFRG
jgi:hypothetical protein